MWFRKSQLYIVSSASKMVSISFSIYPNALITSVVQIIICQLVAWRESSSKNVALARKCTSKYGCRSAWNGVVLCIHSSTAYKFNPIGCPSTLYRSRLAGIYFTNADDISLKDFVGHKKWLFLKFGRAWLIKFSIWSDLSVEFDEFFRFGRVWLK